MRRYKIVCRQVDRCRIGVGLTPHFLQVLGVGDLHTVLEAGDRTGGDYLVADGIFLVGEAAAIHQN